MNFDTIQNVRAYGTIIPGTVAKIVTWRATVMRAGPLKDLQQPSLSLGWLKPNHAGVISPFILISDATAVRCILLTLGHGWMLREQGDTTIAPSWVRARDILARGASLLNGTGPVEVEVDTQSAMALFCRMTNGLAPLLGMSIPSAVIIKAFGGGK